MPQVIGTTAEDTANVFTAFSGSLNSTDQTFTFAGEQNGMTFRNKGDSPVTLVVNGTSYKVPPKATIEIDDQNFNSFDAKTASGTQDFEITSFSRTQLTEALKGEVGKSVKIVACVIRNTGAGWELVGGEHDSINVESVTNDNSKIIITYSFKATKVVSFVACPDETMASEFMLMGASVGVETALINLYQNKSMGGYIYYNGTSWVTSMAEGVSGVSFSNGVLTITHSAITGIKGNVSCRTGMLVPNLGSLGSTTTEVYFRDYAGALVTTPTADMKIYFERGSSNATVSPNNYTNPNGNIWCLGVFEV